MLQIRQGLFETNSSSTHSITICTDSEFETWKNGELIFDYYNEKLVPYTDDIKKSQEAGYEDYATYDNFGFNDYEYYEKHYTTPNGENIVAFGYYGYD